MTVAEKQGERYCKIVDVSGETLLAIGVEFYDNGKPHVIYRDRYRLTGPPQENLKDRYARVVKDESHPTKVNLQFLDESEPENSDLIRRINNSAEGTINFLFPELAA